MKRVKYKTITLENADYDFEIEAGGVAFIFKDRGARTQVRVSVSDYAMPFFFRRFKETANERRGDADNLAAGLDIKD